MTFISATSALLSYYSHYLSLTPSLFSVQTPPPLVLFRYLE
ncbi:hypothetical protein VPMS16_2241 [Vibrio sp. 16]|nr:hypothetical protein VPMS16_2241 [Vibrio sp. 16]